MSHPIKTVCVYCGSKLGNSPAFETAAHQLGERIGAAGLSLVYGAGSIGLMGVVARATMNAGGSVVGIIPKHLDEVEIIQDGLTETYITESMHERKKLMFDRSDAFLILPGGLGTMDETFEIITWAQLSLHRKPIILINQDGYWDHLVALIDHIVGEGFAQHQDRALLSVAATPEEAIGLLLKEEVDDIPSKSAIF